MGTMDRLQDWIYRNKVFVAFELGIVVCAVYVLYSLLMAKEEQEIAAAYSELEIEVEITDDDKPVAPEVKHARRPGKPAAK